MKKKTLFISGILLCSSSFAQQVVSSSGNSYTNSSGSVDFTVGEPVITTHTNSGSTITQGFHQPIWSVVALEDVKQELDITVYPNPITEVINIKSDLTSELRYDLMDTKGAIVKTGNHLDNSEIYVEDLAPGTYQLIFTENQTIIKTFKLIKQL